MRLDFIERKKNIILLLVLALITPAVAGFQYLEWHWQNVQHLFFGVLGAFWIFSYSDWYLNDWLLIVAPDIFLLGSRLLFVAAIARYSQKRSDLLLVFLSGALLVAIEIFVCLTMMAINSIYGIPPGVLMLFPTPDVDTRLFVPVPILLFAGIYLVWKKSKQ